MDIGPATAARFTAALAQCGTIFWNGPMGKFEVAAFGGGTEAVARAVAAATDAGGITVVGGGCCVRVRACGWVDGGANGRDHVATSRLVLPCGPRHHARTPCDTQAATAWQPSTSWGSQTRCALTPAPATHIMRAAAWPQHAQMKRAAYTV